MKAASCFQRLPITRRCRLISSSSSSNNNSSSNLNNNNSSNNRTQGRWETKKKKTAKSEWGCEMAGGWWMLVVVDLKRGCWAGSVISLHSQRSTVHSCFCCVILSYLCNWLNEPRSPFFFSASFLHFPHFSSDTLLYSTSVLFSSFFHLRLLLVLGIQLRIILQLLYHLGEPPVEKSPTNPHTYTYILGLSWNARMGLEVICYYDPVFPRKENKIIGKLF